MALSTQPYKGARDFYPEDKRMQKYLFGVMRRTVEKYGYEEYDAPILEPTELYASKTSEEIVNEQTYTFTDRGGRSVTIRTEMTPSVSRMVAARRQDLAYPLRWYSIPNLWRYERPQRGRLREFWQLNVDLFGAGGLEADHEIIQVADAVLRAYGAKPAMYTIKINSRKLINGFMQQYLQLDDTQASTLIRLIDKMHKMDRTEFLAEAEAMLSPTQRENGAGEKLLKTLKTDDLDDLPGEWQSHESVTSLKQLLLMLAKSGIHNVVFDPTLMRGFDYYTDIVFEIFDNDPANNRSMFGGGRYDGLIAQFGVEPVPTVGFGMGDVPLRNFLDSHGLLPELPTEEEAVIILVGQVHDRALPAVAALREMGLKVAVDFTRRKPEKQLRSAIKRGTAYAVFIGENELASGQFSLKNLKSGTEEKHGLERIVSIIKDYRKR